MKIAIQLFGHLRTYQKCYKALNKHLISKYDCDVFMHTWSLTNHSTKTWHKNAGSKISVLGKEDNLKAIYKLNDLQIEEQKTEDLGIFTSVEHEMSVFGMKAMFHSMHSVNKLRLDYEKKNQVNYDFVVMVRPDILLKTDFNLDQFIEHLDDAIVNQSIFTAGSPLRSVLSYFSVLGATDILFFARPEVLNNLYECEKEFLSIIKPQTTVLFGPEYCLLKTAEQIGYRPILLNYLLKKNFDIIRPLAPGDLRKSMLRLRIKKTGLKLYLFSRITKQIIRFRLDIFGDFQIDFCIGNVGEEKKEPKKNKKKER